MFFTQISRMMSAGVDLNITISKFDEQLTVAVLPRSKENTVKGQMSPLVLTGLPEEMDGSFFDAVMQPMSHATGVLVNLKQFEDSVKQVQKNSQPSKSGQAGKPNVPIEDKATREKREKYEKHMLYGDRLMAENKFGDADMQYRAAIVHAPNDDAKRIITGKIKDVQAKASEGSLFGGITSQQPTVGQPAGGQQPLPMQPLRPAPQPVQPTQPMQPSGLFGEQTARPIQPPQQTPSVQPTMQRPVGQQPPQSHPVYQTLQQPSPQPYPANPLASPQSGDSKPYPTNQYPQQRYPGISPNTADFSVPVGVESQFSFSAPPPHPAEANEGYTEDPDQYNPEADPMDGFGEDDNNQFTANSQIPSYGNASGF